MRGLPLVVHKLWPWLKFYNNAGDNGNTGAMTIVLWIFIFYGIKKDTPHDAEPVSPFIVVLPKFSGLWSNVGTVTFSALIEFHCVVLIFDGQKVEEIPVSPCSEMCT